MAILPDCFCSKIPSSSSTYKDLWSGGLPLLYSFSGPLPFPVGTAAACFYSLFLSNVKPFSIFSRPGDFMARSMQFCCWPLKKGMLFRILTSPEASHARIFFAACVTLLQSGFMSAFISPTIRQFSPFSILPWTLSFSTLWASSASLLDITVFLLHAYFV